MSNAHQKLDANRLWLLRKPVAVPTALTSSEYVYVPRARCPLCRSGNLHTLRSVADQGDGSTRRRTRCRACGHKFFVIVE